MNRLATPFPINDFILEINVKTTLYHNILIEAFTDILNNTNFKNKILQSALYKKRK